MDSRPTLSSKTLLNAREWGAVVILLATYWGVHGFAITYVREPIILFIPTAVAVCILFFNGIRLWPAIYVASLVSGVFIISMPLPHLFVLPVAEVFKVALGAYLLREAGIDPLFRKFRDMFFLIIVVFVISAITPTISALLSIFAGSPYSIDLWGRRYAAAVLTLLIFVPLLLRWLAKRRFSRTLLETAEIVVAFSLLAGLSVTYFILAVKVIAGLPIVYFILIPLFWIALRLRPRFITLALLTLSVIALGSIFLNEFDPVLRTT
ncbi:MAG TPA: MASE1 domain-containing protein, partial [Candidatus Paceibacterota bacterium]|nr:MASE1 domain-containing protein [Candidatus Paceibacterota bacterium]